MSIAITGGGTGGHLVIAKAIKEELNQRGLKPVFIGSTYGQDIDWFEKDLGFEKKYFFDTSGVVNKGFIGKIKSLIKIFSYTLKCKNIFKQHNIDTVFSVGGYSAAPASFAAVLFRKNFYIHEQNAAYGKLNKLLAPYAKTVFCSFDKNSPLQDYPVRNIFFEKARVRKKVKTIIFLGGSQGAAFINEYAMKVAPALDQQRIKIIHQCGKRDLEKVSNYYKEHQIDADVFDFYDDFAQKIAAADFAVSRAGASSLWELSASMLPTLFIPFPYAAANHQVTNAEFLVDKGLAFMKEQHALQEKDLYDLTAMDFTEISLGLKKIIHQEGAKKIVDYLLQSKN